MVRTHGNNPLRIPMSRLRHFFTPSRIIVLSFAATILAGALVLMLPGTHRVSNMKFVDALFMSTSAVCVTGLSLYDISSQFTHFGQWTLMVLFQIGGLGIMTFSIFFAYILRRDISMIGMHTVFSSFASDSRINRTKLITSVVKFTFIFEGIGALLLTLYFIIEQGYPLARAIYHGVFHSVSAFCNAGFALYPDSFMRFHDSLFFNLVITSLIIIGGIGFIVILEIYYRIKGELPFLSLHTKMALIITLTLIVGGTLTIFFLEHGFYFASHHFSTGDSLLASYFQSVTARTAGFNTIDIGSLSWGTLFFLIMLMFIGASPGSTGGGIKTTTAGVLFAVFLNRLKGRTNIRFMNRTIGQETVSRAIAIAISSFILVSVALLGLTFIYQLNPWFAGKDPFLQILFEEVSAFGTVGLSTGITPQMDTYSKMILIFLMFIGRVGPLALAFAIGGEGTEDKIMYAEENLMVG